MTMTCSDGEFISKKVYAAGKGAAALLTAPMYCIFKLYKAQLDCSGNIIAQQLEIGPWNIDKVTKQKS
jgi:hypothetical protein